ncbi:hypothetical protein AYO47_09020, partial [Planctomyces sp. SCGC AG-212-M04]
AVIPIPYRSKNPNRKGWEKLRITAESVPQFFNGKPQNVGVLLGQVSGGLVDVDLDHQLAVELAPKHLPPTPAIFGRASKARSHWIYRVQGPIETTKFRSKSAGMLVEVRSDGMQTVFPPSTHESGEPIGWDEAYGDPAEIIAQTLLDAVRGLTDDILSALGEPPTRESPSKPASSAIEPRPAISAQAACLAALRRLSIGDHRDGSLRLFTCACRAVEFGLDDNTAIATIRTYAAERPFGREWTDDEILKRVRDAERRCQRGEALRREDQDVIPLGGRDLVTGRLVLSPKRTVPSAQAFIHEFYDHPEGRRLHSYGGALWAWQQNRFVECEPEALVRQLQGWLHQALRYQSSNGQKPLTLVPFESNPTTVNAVLATVRAEAHIEAGVQHPAWLPKRSNDPPASDLLVGRTTLLCLTTMQTQPGTPRFFTMSALDFDPDLGVAVPTVWLSFLQQLFGSDIEAIEALQEWFGYCLVADTSQQKMLLIIGPRRSGKGTIARVLTHLVGPNNVAGPTTSSLAGTFGLQPLVGKSLAIVSDARFSGENVSTVVERLLCISGEDALTIDRKHTTSVTMKLPTRFMFLSNELPRLNDASSALAGRFVILRLTETFYGREDQGLTDRLIAELPGILNWSLDGWRRLKQRGHFVQPGSSAEIMKDLEDLASPVRAFVREECDLLPGSRILVSDLYLAFRAWWERDGRPVPPSRQVFGRDLAAAFAGIAVRRNTSQQRYYEGIALRGRSHD